jgi:hypothetical protein
MRPDNEESRPRRQAPETATTTRDKVTSRVLEDPDDPCHDDGRWFDRNPHKAERVRPICRCEINTLIAAGEVPFGARVSGSMTVRRLADGIRVKRLDAAWWRGGGR